jgi:trimethylamine-N-oxide reductase (cytochrome c)
MIDPLYESRTDFEAFKGVAERLGIGLTFTEGKSEMDWVKQIYNASDVPLSFEEFWEKQRYVFEGGSLEEQEAETAFASFREDPEANPLGTPSGKIEIYSETIDEYDLDDCPPTPQYIPNDEYLGSPKTDEYPFHVMSPHVKHRLHSQFDNAAFVRKWQKVNEKEPVWINATDAQDLGIEDGDIVRVFNDRGQTLAGAVVTERIRPNTIALSYGSWWERENPGEIGSLVTDEGNVNFVTQDNHTSGLAQGTAAKTALADVEKYGGD